MVDKKAPKKLISASRVGESTWPDHRVILYGPDISFVRNDRLGLYFIIAKI